MNKPEIKVETQTQEMDADTRNARNEIVAIGARLRPYGTQVAGFAIVYYYTNTSNDGGAYKSLSMVGHLPEKFADGGIKDLAKHCMSQAFGRKIPELRK